MRESGYPADIAAVESLVRQRPRRTVLGRIGRFARAYPMGFFGAVLLVFFGLVAIFAPLIAPYSPVVQDVPNRLLSPNSQFLLGTDNFGRDVLSRIIYGTRVSLYAAFFSVTLATVVGTLLGVGSGYLGGRVDLVMQRLVDSLMGFPPIVLAMIMVVGLGPSLNNVTVALAIIFTPSMIRMSRSSALSVREELYVTAAKTTGGSTLRIVLRHVLPNSLAPVFILATGFLGRAIVIEAALSFLGLGVPPPNPSWGSMLDAGSSGHLRTAPWLTVFPGVALAFVVFSFSFLGDAARDALDPRLKGR